MFLHHRGAHAENFGRVPRGVSESCYAQYGGTTSFFRGAPSLGQPGLVMTFLTALGAPLSKRNRILIHSTKIKHVGVMEPQLISQAQVREGHRDQPFTLPEMNLKQYKSV